MNKTLFLSALFCASAAANAQSTLTNSINPQPSDNYTYYQCAYQTPGAAGANITWDFSQINYSSSASVQYASCNSNPSCGSFSGANLVSNQTGNAQQTATIFLTTNNSKMSTAGAIAGGVTMNYSDPEDMLHFPFTYNSNYTDNFAVSYFSGMQYYRKGSITVTGDAYGTLKTPTGTFLNVIRVHRVEHYQDSLNYGGTPMVTQYVSDIYAWYSPLVREMLFTTATTTVGGSTFQQYAYYPNIVPTGVMGISNLDATLDMYPNPVQGQLNVKFRLNTAQDLRISIVDIMGKEVGVITEGKFQSGDQHFTYNTSGLAAGMYIVRVQSGENTVVRKIQVQ